LLYQPNLEVSVISGSVRRAMPKERCKHQFRQ